VHPGRPPQPVGGPRPPRHAEAHAGPRELPVEAPALPLTPEQAAENEARRGRAQLLRTYETSTLTRANFCALKGISEAALEAQLVQARAERGEREPRPPRPGPRPAGATVKP
jgi:hypothetical protein